ncbi:MAG: DinB family protein [Chloroflexi bacterium]|nr:DinB family protein [Chloroflexota bacterium]
MDNFFRDTLARELEALRKRTLGTVAGLSRGQLLWRPAGSDANPIGFLLWHLARREDYHLQTRIGGGPQLWQTEGWHGRFGIDPEATGFGFTAQQVRDFPMPGLLDIIGYYYRVREATLAYLLASTDASLQGPMPGMPETPIGVYLLARAGHEHEHWGQMDYLKGIMPAEE